VEFGVGLRRLEPVITALPKIQHRTSPFTDFDARGFAWITPRFTAEITYSEIMRGVLRDPVLRAIGRASRRCEDFRQLTDDRPTRTVAGNNAAIGEPYSPRSAPA
jgi:hypothetical protein